MKDNDNSISQDFLEDIKCIINDASHNAVRSVDFCRVQMYWNIGERIFEEYVSRLFINLFFVQCFSIFFRICIMFTYVPCEDVIARQVVFCAEIEVFMFLCV